MIASAKRHWQVWLDWLRWPPFWALLWTIVAYWVVMVIFFSLDAASPVTHTRAYDFIMESIEDIIAVGFFLTPVVVLGILPILMVWRVRAQMQDWRSTVIPRFRRPHLMVSALIVLAIVLIMGIVPTIAYEFLQYQDRWRGHYDWSEYLEYEVWMTAGSLGEGLFVSVLAGWITVWLSPMLAVALLLTATTIGSLLHWPDIAWHYLAIEQRQSWRPAHGRILFLYVADFAFFLLLWIRLSRISSRSQGLSADERMPWLSDLLVKLDTPPVGGLIHAGRWKRARHRRMLGLGHRFIWLVAIYVAAVIALGPVLATGTRWLTNLEYASWALIAAGLVSTVAISLSWPQRIAALADIELLRPATRAAFAREIGLAILFDTIEISLTTMLVMFVPIYYWSPSSLSNPLFWQSVAVLLLMQVLIFGMLVWSMNRSFNTTTVAVAAVVTWGGVLIINANFGHHTLLPVYIAAAIGVLLSADAYRRWVRPDFD